MDETELNKALREWFKINKDKFKIRNQSNRNFLARNIIAKTIKSNLESAGRWTPKKKPEQKEISQNKQPAGANINNLKQNQNEQNKAAPPKENKIEQDPAKIELNKKITEIRNNPEIEEWRKSAEIAKLNKDYLNSRW